MHNYCWISFLQRILWNDLLLCDCDDTLTEAERDQRDTSRKERRDIIEHEWEWRTVVESWPSGASVGIKSSVRAIDSELGSRGLIRRRGWLVIGSIICCWTQTVGPLLSRACPSWRGVTKDHSIAPANYFFLFFVVHHPLRTCFLWPWFFFLYLCLVLAQARVNETHTATTVYTEAIAVPRLSEGSRIFASLFNYSLFSFKLEGDAWMWHGTGRGW